MLLHQVHIPLIASQQIVRCVVLQRHLETPKSHPPVLLSQELIIARVLLSQVLTIAPVL